MELTELSYFRFKVEEWQIGGASFQLLLQEQLFAKKLLVSLIMFVLALLPQQQLLLHTPIQLV
jgi:hypothetical protein